MQSGDYQNYLILGTLLAIETKLNKSLKNQEKIMAAIDNLKANIAALQAEVEKVVAKPAGVPEADVQAAADAIAAETAKLQTVAP